MASIVGTLLHSVHVSRPVFWFITVWLYLVVGGSHYDSSVFGSATFWLGLFYVTYPLNLLVYAWNDLDDRVVDELNSRKGRYLNGALTTAQQLWKIFMASILLNIGFCVAFVVLCDCGKYDVQDKAA